MPVHSVTDLTLAARAIERELAMVKVRGKGDARVEALQLAEAFRAKVIDATTESFIFEITGAPRKIDDFVDLMRPIGAIGITPLVGGFIQVTPSLVQAVTPGRTAYFKNGAHISYTDPAGDKALATWDQWVANREVPHNTAVAKLLNETGLKEPIPGLSQMAGQGKWVDCPGYGKCWQPPAPPADVKAKPGPRPGDPNSMSSLLQPDPNAPPGDSATSQGLTGTVKKASTPKKTYTGYSNDPNAGGITYADMLFPCGPDYMYYGPACKPASACTRWAARWVRRADTEWAVMGTGWHPPLGTGPSVTPEAGSTSRTNISGCPAKTGIMNPQFDGSVTAAESAGLPSIPTMSRESLRLMVNTASFPFTPETAHRWNESG